MALDNAFNRIFNVIKDASSDVNRPDTMVFGEVKTIDPLSVQIIDGAGGLTLSEKFLFLGQNCRPYKVTIPHSHLVDAMLTESTKAIKTSGINAGVATDVPQNASYDTKTQDATDDDDKGTTEREEKMQSNSVDLGGASLSMSVDVSGSPIAGSNGAGTVTSTIDLSTFTVSDSGHQHIIAEHKTQDVHFPGTDYEESVTIQIYPRLKVGDKVLMFAFNNYQMYYVAERIEEAE